MGLQQALGSGVVAEAGVVTLAKPDDGPNPA